MKKYIKSLLVKILRRLGETSPIVISWKDIGDLEVSASVLNLVRLGNFYKPTLVSPPEKKKIVVLAPHPDDEVIGMGGTIIQMLQAGCSVTIIHFTLGDAPEVYEESQKAAAEVGFDTVYLDFTVDRIPCDKGSIAILKSKLEKLQADIIFTPFLLDDNDDHRRINELLAEVYKTYPEISPSEIWSYQVYSFIPANAIVNITKVMDKKIRAIECYRSQYAARDWSHYTRGLNAFNIRFIPGFAGKEYAETFYRTNVAAYLKLCQEYFSSPQNRNSTTKPYSNQHYATGRK